MPVPQSSPTHTLREAPAVVGAAGDAALRRRMVRLAYTPALVVVFAAAGVVAYLWSTWEPDDATTVQTGFGDAASLSVLGAALLVAAAAIAAGVRSASTQARTTLEQYAVLRRGAERSRHQIQNQLRRLEAGEPPSPPASGHTAAPVPADGALDSLAQELALAQRTAEAAVAQAATLNRPAREPAAAAVEGNGAQGLQAADRVAVFVNLARRLQSLLHREIKVLDELENQVEDPEILKGVFQVDHLATRIRRYAENLAVLGGAVSRRQWTKPVPLTEILRSSAAEVEHYQRIKLVPPIEGTVRGQAVADVIHLLSELMENATVYSAPQTQVLLRTSHVTAGLAIEVEDRGLGMTADEQRRMNALLADPEGVDVAALLTDGRIGLYVVGTLARRHDIAVQLRSNIYGGIQAVLVLPHTMLGNQGGNQRGGQESGREGGQSKVADAAPGAVRPADAAPGPAAGGLGAPEHTVRLQRGRHAAPSTPGTPPDAEAPRHAAVDRPDGRLPASAAGIGGQPPLGGQSQPVAQPQPGGPGGQPQPGAQPQPIGQPHPGAQPQPAAQSHPGGHPHPDGQPQLGAEGRPRLPRRQKQQHIVPELRDAPTAAPGGAASPPGEEPVHNPGLMAAFQRGVGRADAEERGGTPPTPPYDGDSSPH
ncbi:ATP-binding protein [Streptomyces sp. CA-250714]|uniref:sensor histidine kinase n=1 Tax=Streptomyces sp. CA-250714 TaxID=3240060 RepID=UPI003D90309C